jgi:hypothetical protein
MSTFTTNYRLVKPAASDKYSISDFNNNFDTLDTALKDIANKAGDGIINGLSSTSATHSLSAAQGKILNDKVEGRLLTSGGTITGNLTVNGSIAANGGITIGAGFGKIYTFTKSIVIGTDWTDTGIGPTDLPSGAYIVHMTGIYNTDMNWQESTQYAGLMSWYSGETNAGETAEIPLHTTGHAHNGYNIQLAAINHSRASLLDTRLYIKCSTAFSRATSIRFTFVKIV